MKPVLPQLQGRRRRGMSQAGRWWPPAGTGSGGHGKTALPAHPLLYRWELSRKNYTESNWALSYSSTVNNSGTFRCFGDSPTNFGTDKQGCWVEQQSSGFHPADSGTDAWLQSLTLPPKVMGSHSRRKRRAKACVPLWHRGPEVQSRWEKRPMGWPQLRFVPGGRPQSLCAQSFPSTSLKFSVVSGSWTLLNGKYVFGKITLLSPCKYCLRVHLLWNKPRPLIHKG